MTKMFLSLKLRFSKKKNHKHKRNRLECSLRMQEFGCSNSNCDRSMWLKRVVKSRPYNCDKCESHRSSLMTIINRCPVSQLVWHVTMPSLVKDHEGRVYMYVKIGSFLTIIVTYPYEWKNSLEEVEKPKQTNKTINTAKLHVCVHVYI